MKKSNWVSQKEFSQAAGISSARVSQLRKSGALSGAFKKQGRTRHVYHLEKGMAALLELDASQRRDKQSSTGELQRERARLVAARREKIELELRVRSGELVEKREVQNQIFSASRILRDSLLSIPGRIGATVAAKSKKGEAEVIKILNREIRRALMDLKKSLQKVVDERK